MSSMSNGSHTIRATRQLFVLQEVSYSARTDQERFLDYESLNIKHHDWDNTSEHYIIEDFVATKNTTDRIANFVRVEAVTVKNHLMSANSFAGKIDFHDPWYVDQNDNQPDTFQENLNSPYYPKGKYGESIGGVFLSQGFDDPTKPFYSVKAETQQTTEHGQTVNWDFLFWEGTDVSYEDANSTQTAVVFN